jgi:O-antigen ligase
MSVAPPSMTRRGRPLNVDEAARRVEVLGTRVTQAALTAVVGSLFLEKWEKNNYFSGAYPIPDLFFVSAIVVLAVVVVVLQRRGRRAIAQSPLPNELAVAALLILLILLSGTALIVAPVPISSAGQVIKTAAHVTFLAGAAVLLGRVLNLQLLRFVVHVYFILAVVACAVAVLQAFDQNALHTGASEALDLQTRKYDWFRAPQSILSEPAYLGYAGLTGLLIAFSSVIRARSAWVLLAGLVCAAGFVLSASIGAFAAALVVGGHLFVRAIRRPDRPPISNVLIAIVAVALIVGLTPIRDVVVYRLTNLWSGSDPSALYRREVDKAAIDIWERSPVVGVGLGNSRRFLPSLVHISFLPHFKFKFVDASAYLALLAETGPLGTLGLVCLLGLLLRRIRRPEARLDDLTRAIIVLVAFEFTILNGFVLPPFWFWVGLRLAVERADSPAALGVSG